MKLLAIILLIFSSNYIFAIDHNVLRVRFSKCLKSEIELALLVTDLKAELPSKDPLVNSYFGACKGIMARNTYNILSKLKNVKECLLYLNKAVDMEPNNTEIRLVRISIEQHIPSIAGFALHVTEDINFLKSFLFNCIINEKSVNLYNNTILVFKKNNYVKEMELKALDQKFKLRKNT